jgi:small conductance mechanosensitive channel
MGDTIPASSIPSGETSVGESGLDFDQLLPYILGKLVDVIIGALIILAGYFLIVYLRRYLRKMVVEHQEQKNALNLMEKLLTGFIVVISITLALRTVGIDMTLLVSVSILGLSYGLQDIIKNYVAGILIMFKAPFKIGDVVKIRNFTGKIEAMDFQSTTLSTFDKRSVTIYNSDVMTQSITNYSRYQVRRFDFDITVGYGSDTAKALGIYEKVLSRYEGILKTPKFRIVFKKFDDSGLVFTVKAWYKRPCNILGIKTELAMLFHQAFDEEGIFMPFTKGVELDQDYTMTEGRKAKINTFKVALEAAGAESLENAEGNLEDFDEPE